MKNSDFNTNENDSKFNDLLHNVNQYDRNDQVNYVFDPPCGNGVNEELFNKVVDVLSHQNCDNRGKPFTLYDSAEFNQLSSDKLNKIRYNLNEGFDESTYKKTHSYLLWVCVISFIVLGAIAYKRK